MKKFPTTKKIREMTNPELIAYKHELSAYSSELHDHITEASEVWNYVLQELKRRLEDIQYTVLEAEDDREDSIYNYYVHTKTSVN